jgi:hypothetical protein
VQLVHSRRDPALPGASCMQPFWSVSTWCSLYIAILVRIYTMQLVYHHLGPFLPGATYVSPYWSVSTRCSWCIAILVRLYVVHHVYLHIGPSLHGETCAHLSWSVSTWCNLCKAINWFVSTRCKFPSLGVSDVRASAGVGLVYQKEHRSVLCGHRRASGNIP